MPQVTKFNFPLETSWIKRLDKIADRVTNKKRKRDAVLIVEGAEGEGKTTFSTGSAYYLSEKTGRYFGAENIFFKLEELMKAIQENSNGIFMWDEPALQMLSTDRSRIVADATRLLMMARKKRHILLINITHFNKFNDYIIVDRPVGMIKIYTRPGTDQPRFIYIPKKNLASLYHDWRMKKKKNYFRYGTKLCRGAFPNVMDENYEHNVLDEFDIDLYEQRKDEAIGAVGGKSNGNVQGYEKKYFFLAYKVFVLLKQKKITQTEAGKILGIPQQTISDWGLLPQKVPNLLVKRGEIPNTAHI